ncbi:MAG: hypothetical protein ABIR96_11825 [Bdellovibrionota bacterium]
MFVLTSAAAFAEDSVFHVPQIGRQAPELRASVDGRKTLCSITINSDDELKVFRDRMDPDKFKFVELIADPDDPQWFARACQKMSLEVKAGRSGCDVLLVSGHFGGVFFGDSNASLDIDELDRHACAHSCDAILKQPKEVFLMGCNTLANKERDHRGDEEYLKILVGDGVPREFAERVVAYRYGDVGYSLEQRMSAIFSASARIYGFASTGPVGAKAAPALKSYLAKNKNYSAHVDALDGSPNVSLAQAFSGTSFRQTRGNEAFSHNYYAESCGLLDADPNGKVRSVDQLISSGRFFAHADKAVAAVIEAQNASGGSIPDARTLARWRSNSGFMKQLRDTQKSSPSLFEIRSDLRYMQDVIEFGSGSIPVTQNQVNILSLMLSKPLSFISKDQVCSIAKKHPEVSLESGMLPPQDLWNSFTLEAIGCFATISPKISDRLVAISLGRVGSSPQWLVDAASRFLAKRGELSSDTQKNIFEAALNERSPVRRSSMLRSLASLENPPNWPNLIGAIGNQLGPNERDAMASALSQRLRNPKGDPTAWAARYVDPLLRSPDPIQQEIGLRALQKAHVPNAPSLIGGGFLDPSWVNPVNAVLYAQVLRGIEASGAQKENLSTKLSTAFPGSGASMAVFDPVKDHVTKDPGPQAVGAVWDNLNGHIMTITPRQCLEQSFLMGTGEAGDNARWWCLEQAKIKPDQHECFSIASEIRGESRSGAYWSCLKSSQAQLSPEVCDNAAQSISNARQGDDLRWNCLESLKKMNKLDEASCLRLAEGMSLRGQKIRANWNCLDFFSRR